ncbi:MAG: hypothetical protein FWF25_00500 [Propionibacteriaceae bacterium]|nr:hypothetical protein [Propionibacteriaceae bacterium]
MTMKTHRKRNAVIAAVVGVAMLMGGSTYALWSVNADLSGIRIESGDLALDITGAIKVWDVSDELSPESRQDPLTVPCTDGNGQIESTGQLVADDGKSVLDHDWTTVPGDKILIQVPFRVKLDGYNMIATLSASARETYLNDDGGSELKNFLSISFGLYDLSGEVIPVLKSQYQGWGSLAVAYSTNPAPNHPDPYTPTVISPTGVRDFVLCAFVTFNDSVQDQGLNGTATSLILAKSVTLRLQQQDRVF